MKVVVEEQIVPCIKSGGNASSRVPPEHAAGIAGTRVGAQPSGNTSSSAFLVRNVFAAGDKRSVSRAWNHHFGLGNSRPGCNCSLACVCVRAHLPVQFC